MNNANPADNPSILFVSEPALLRPFVLHPTCVVKGWRHQIPATGQWVVTMDEANVTHTRMFTPLVFEPCLLYQGIYVNNHEIFWWVLPEEIVEKDPKITELVNMARQQVLVHVQDHKYVVPKVVPYELPPPPANIRNN